MNFTPSVDFFLLRLTESPSLQIPLFLLFLFVYLVTLFGNLMMLSIILLDPHLYYPMYLFLWNFSLMDLAFSSNTVPGMLCSILSPDNSISFHSCMVQVFFFHSFGNSENLLLSAMAYDRYTAICKPLRYSVLMSSRKCLALCSGCCIFASLHALLHVGVTSLLKFHHPAHLPHFFCDIPPLLEISISDTSFNQLLIFIEGSIVALIPTMLILLSYIRITISILRIHSNSGRRKAFSTCASHLTVFLLFSGSAVFMYFKPSSGPSRQKESALTLVYTAITPMFNPYIYCLRNSEVKAAFRKRLGFREAKKHKLKKQSDLHGENPL